MTHILFADTSHPKAYGFDDLAAHAMGGTESSLLRTAQILSNRSHQITIFQQQRNENVQQHKIHFIGPKGLDQLTSPEHVIVLRKFPQLINFKQHFFTSGSTPIKIGNMYSNAASVLNRPGN